jgi:hypothetical protein
MVPFLGMFDVGRKNKFLNFLLEDNSDHFVALVDTPGSKSC